MCMSNVSNQHFLVAVLSASHTEKIKLRSNSVHAAESLCDLEIGFSNHVSMTSVHFMINDFIQFYSVN